MPQDTTGFKVINNTFVMTAKGWRWSLRPPRGIDGGYDATPVDHGRVT